MAIPLDTAGGIFSILGKIGYLLDSINLFRGEGNLSAAGATSVGSGVESIVGQFTSASLHPLIDSLYAHRDAFRAVPTSFLSQLQRLAQSSLIKLADDDVSLSSLTVQAAMRELIDQMTDASETVKASVATAGTPAADAGNIGDAVMVASNLGPDGIAQQYVIAETLTATCATDSQRGATAGSESWLVTSPVAQPDLLAWDFPKGSGVNVTVLATDAAGDQNLLVDGDFEDFTLDAPNEWTIEVGTAGETIFDGTVAEVFTGNTSLKILGNGAQLTAITQVVEGLEYSTVLAVNCWLKVSAVPSGGVLAIELIDQDGNVVDDDAGTANAITKNLTSATTSFVPLNGFFRTPKVLPDELAVRVRLTTALESGKSLLLDRLAIVEATRLYAGGPYVAIFSGAEPSIYGDEFTVAIANNYAGKFQVLCDKVFGMRQLGMQLPSATGGAETISDSLIG